MPTSTNSTRLLAALPTPEALEAEWLRRGPLAWSMRYATLPHPTLGILHFRDVMRDYQRALLEDPSERVIIVKARQIGISQTLGLPGGARGVTWWHGAGGQSHR